MRAGGKGRPQPPSPCPGCGATKRKVGKDVCWYCGRSLAASVAGPSEAKRVIKATMTSFGRLEKVHLIGDMNTVDVAIDCTIDGNMNVFALATRCTIRGNMNTISRDDDCTVIGTMNTFGVVRRR